MQLLIFLKGGTSLKYTVRLGDVWSISGNMAGEIVEFGGSERTLEAMLRQIVSC